VTPVSDAAKDPRSPSYRTGGSAIGVWHEIKIDKVPNGFSQKGGYK
jgi:hypothetical protein